MNSQIAMISVSSPLSLDAVRARFDSLLRDADANTNAATAPQSPDLDAIWNAFTRFAGVEVACDEESLFFECGPSSLDESRFYVNFTRTFFGRDAGNHFWSSELNCDFLFENTPDLEELGTTIEAEEFGDDAGERARFFEKVGAQHALWHALQGRQSLSSTIYFGES